MHPWNIAVYISIILLNSKPLITYTTRTFPWHVK